ncbi:hypothetical protein Tco_1161828 [Tanacetum coccineum]
MKAMALARKLREMEIGTQSSSCDETLKDLMKLEYLHDDGDVFVNYSWERAFSIDGDVYQEWCMEFFSIVYFERGVDRTKIMTENNLEINDMVFDHKAYWRRTGRPPKTYKRTSLIIDLLMRIVHKIIVGTFGYRTGRIEENSDIFGGHYVTKIAKSLGYYVDEELDKCSEPIECEKWTAKMFAKEFDMQNMCLQQEVLLKDPDRVQSEQEDESSGLNSSWGDWNASLDEIEHREVWRDSMLMRNNYMLEHSMPILHYLADQANHTYPTYEPPNVPPYPYSYVSYPYPYTHYPDIGNHSQRGGHYGAMGDGYFAGLMPSFGGTFIVPSSGFDVGGSSRGVQRNEDDDDDTSMSKQRVHTDDDMDD